MDVDRMIRIVKGIPKEKWSDEKTIKKVIQDAGRTSGKTFSDAELNKYVQQFKSVAKGGLSPSLIAALLKNGVSKSQIDEIKNIMKDKQ